MTHKKNVALDLSIEKREERRRILKTRRDFLDGLALSYSELIHRALPEIHGESGDETADIFQYVQNEGQKKTASEAIPKLEIIREMSKEFTEELIRLDWEFLGSIGRPRRETEI